MAEPIRMCAGCRERRAKHEMIRVVRTPDGNIVADAGNKVSGRGVYLCHRAECLKRVRKSRALERMLEMEISEETYGVLAAALDGAHG